MEALVFYELEEAIGLLPPGMLGREVVISPPYGHRLDGQVGAAILRGQISGEIGGIGAANQQVPGAG